MEALVYPATMSAHNPSSDHTPAISIAARPDLPNSQESVVSTVSSTFSAPKLPDSVSNLSTSTAADTDLTSLSSNVAPAHSKAPEEPMPISPDHSRVVDAQTPTPRIDTAAANAPRTGNTAPSPMVLDSPIAQGFKRTADGSVKGNGVTPHRVHEPVAAHKRNKSMDVHSGSRIGELSAQLKTRLSYAMVKVQNGWERQSLEELEEVHSQRGSPNSAPSRTERLTFDSPAVFERRRRPSGVSDNSDLMVLSPASDPSRSHNATPSLYWRQTKPAMSAAANLISVTGSQHGLGLAPAADIQSGRRRRSSISHPPPSLLASSGKKHSSDLGSGTRGPVTPRAGILRMPSQQAEKDAVDTLLFMSSPNNSQRFPNASQPAPSPLRAEAPQRRVMFEAYPPQEKRVVYQPPMPPPAHHQYGPYAAHPAR